MADAFTCKARHVGKESHNVWGGKACTCLIRSRCNAQCSDRCRIVPRHSPQLPRKLSSRSLAIRSGDRRHIFGKWPKEFCREFGKCLAWVGVGNMHSAMHHSLRTRDNSNCTGGDCSADEIFAVECGALKCAKNCAGRNFPMVDGKAGHYSVGQCRIGTAYQLPELHYCSPFAFHNKGISSDTSTSRFMSGIIPINGPMRVIVLRTTGAAV